MHDYNLDISGWTKEEKKSYIEAKNYINGNNIDIYILIIKKKNLNINIKVKKGEILKLNLFSINY